MNTFAFWVSMILIIPTSYVFFAALWYLCSEVFKSIRRKK